MQVNMFVQLKMLFVQIKWPIPDATFFLQSSISLLFHILLFTYYLKILTIVLEYPSIPFLSLMRCMYFFLNFLQIIS